MNGLCNLIDIAVSGLEDSVTPSPPVSRSPSLDAKLLAFSGSSREASPPRKAQFSKVGMAVNFVS